MLPGRSLIAEIPENTPLPSHSSLDLTHAGPRGRRRFEQIGSGAVVAGLDATLDNSESMDVWLLCTLHVGAGHAVEAFIHNRASLAKSGFFWGLCESQSQAEWVKDEMKTWLASQLQTRNMSLPGVQVCEPKTNEDDGRLAAGPAGA